MTVQDHPINQWLIAFGEQSGQDFSLDEQGLCILKTKHEMYLQISVDREGQYGWLNIHLHDVHDVSRDKVLQKALTFNLFQSDLRGAAIALNENKTALFLSHAVSVKSCTESLFAELVETIGDAAAKLKQEFSPGHTLEPSDQAEITRVESHEMLGMLRC